MEKSTGRLIGVVGPSGVGKDTVMEAVAAADPAFLLVRRVITRAPGLGGEDYQAISEEGFAEAVLNGAFCLHWRAHGLRYGVPRSTEDDIANGAKCMVNLSRTVLEDVAQQFPNFAVLNLTAEPETLAARLAARGRETPEDIAARLARADRPLPPGMPVVTIANDGPLEATVAKVLTALSAKPQDAQQNKFKTPSTMGA